MPQVLTGNKDVRCIKQDIINKEARGEDASYERWLLIEWSKYPGWEEAGDLPPEPKGGKG